jgi:oxygen-dependent protoporphyrinogen oxidase
VKKRLHAKELSSQQFLNKDMDKKIAIIGSGISGLCAGFSLKEAGLQPIIFEKESFLGGRMSSETVSDFVIDKGAYTFPEFHKKLKRFVQVLGMEDALSETSGTSSIFSKEQFYPMKIGSPSDFLKQKLFSFKCKKDMVKLYLYAQSMSRALSLNEPTKKTFQLEKESSADFLLKTYGEEILEKVAYPIFSEIYLSTPEENSKLAFLVTLKNLSKFKIFAFDKGMGSLPELLARDLDVRLNSPVLRITPTKKGGPYELEVGGRSQPSHLFDVVISAIPLPLLPDIFGNLPNALNEYARDIDYSPSIVVALAVDATYPGTSMINNLLRRDFSIIANVVFDHHKSPFRVPQGKSLITAILSEQASQILMGASEEDIVKSVLHEIGIILPGFAERLIFARVYRWPYGALKMRTGILSKQHAIRRNPDASLDNLYLAGDGLNRSSLEVSFITGMAAANRIISNMRH